MISVVHRPDKATARATPGLSRLWPALRRNGRRAGAFLALSGVLGLLLAPSLAAGLPLEQAPVRLHVAGELGRLNQSLQGEPPFWTRELLRLDSLAGRHVRVASSTQADFVRALGACPLRTSFS